MVSHTTVEFKSKICQEKVLEHLSSSFSSYVSQDMPASDVIIVCNDGRIPGHKLVMASISSMLYDAMKNVEEEEMILIIVPDFSVKNLTQYLSYVYSLDEGRQCSQLKKTLGVGDADISMKSDKEHDLKQELDEEYDSPSYDTGFEDFYLQQSETINKIEPKVIPVVKNVSLKKTKLEKTHDDSGSYSDPNQGVFKRVICKHCDKVFGKMFNFKRHITNSHPEVDETLNTKVYKNNPDFTIETRDRIISNKKLKKRKKLNADQLDDFGNEMNMKTKFSCDYCDEYMASRSNLTRHIERRHPEEAKKLVRKPRKKPVIMFPAGFNGEILDPETGEILDKELYKKKKMVEYMKARGNWLKNKDFFLFEYFIPDPNDKSKFICKICQAHILDMPYMTKHKMREHLLAEHNIEKEVNYKFVCSQCGKGFEKEKFRNICELKHTNSFTIFCPVETCGKGFYEKGPLQKHMRTHTGETPYQCDVCLKRFKQRTHLKTHMKVHNG